MSSLVQDTIKQIQAIAKDFQCSATNPYELLTDIKNYKTDRNDVLEYESFYRQPKSQLICGKNVQIQPFTTISGNVILGNNVFVGSFSMLRGPLFLGDNVKIGAYNDICRSTVLRNTEISHDNRVFDSVVGEDCWLSSLVHIHNLRLDRKSFKISWDNKRISVCKEDGQKYGAAIDHRVTFSLLTKIMPGAYIAPDQTITGPCYIDGGGRIYKWNATLQLPD